jgi:glycosyltransferase involved in cell wall biosynthesis
MRSIQISDLVITTSYFKGSYMPLHVAHLIDTLSWGGAQKLLVTFAEASKVHNFLPTVISLRERNDSPFHDQLQALGVRVVTFPCRRLIEPKQIWQLARFLRRERFDILHTHLTQANILGGLIGRLLGIPVVSSLHNTHARKRRFHAMRQQIEAWVLRYSVQRVIAVGYAVADVQRKRLPDTPIDIIPNAVSTISSLSSTQRDTLRRTLVGDHTRPLLISVGRLTAQKGYHDLLTAFATVREFHPLAALIIVGRGDLQAELAAQITALGLDGHVFLLGARTDVPDLLAASDIYVSASHCSSA